MFAGLLISLLVALGLLFLNLRRSVMRIDHNPVLRFRNGGYTPFGATLSWHVGDHRAAVIGWLIYKYCQIVMRPSEISERWGRRPPQ